MTRIFVLGGVIMAAFLAVAADPTDTLAQATKNRSIGDYSCKEIMSEDGFNRNAAIALLHGFLMGKSNAPLVDTETLRKATSDLIDQCLDNPKSKAIEVLAKIRK